MRKWALEHHERGGKKSVLEVSIFLFLLWLPLFSPPDVQSSDISIKTFYLQTTLVLVYYAYPQFWFLVAKIRNFGDWGAFFFLGSRFRLHWEWPIQVLGPWKWEEEAPLADILEYENHWSQPCPSSVMVVPWMQYKQMRIYFALITGSHLKWKFLLGPYRMGMRDKHSHLEVRDLKADVFNLMKFLPLAF